jgi:uncharacterized protein DUF3617
MKRAVCGLSMAIALAGGVGAQAPALDVKMGLWEMTSVNTLSGRMPQVDTSKMTAEQRAAMDAAMKNMTAPHTTVTKSCVTREKLEKSVFMMEDRPGMTCTQRVGTNTRVALDAAVTCKGDRPMAGQMHLDALSPTSVKGTMKWTGAIEGGSLTGSMTLTAKWLGADCGNQK